MELLVALFLTAVMLLAMVQLVNAGASTARLQDEQADLQDRLRFAAGSIFTAVSGAGFSPEPWNGAFDRTAIGADSGDDVVFSNDRLVVRTWSDRNCFDSFNPDLDSSGRPRFYIHESAFDLNGSNFLTRTCRYGPSPTGLVTQVRRQGLLGGVEAFHLLFGEDVNGDDDIDRWVRAGDWFDEAAIKGVRAGIVLAGETPVTAPQAQLFELPGAEYRGDRDGRLRHAVEFSYSVRSRTR
jgi:hypothetical protein